MSATDDKIRSVTDSLNHLWLVALMERETDEAEVLLTAINALRRTRFHERENFARAQEAEAAVARVRAVRADWEFLPVWGPNEQGLHILDDVDVEGLHQALDDALDGVVRPEPTRGNQPERRRTAPEGDEPRQDDQSRVTDSGEAARGDECGATIPRRYGYATCSLTSGHSEQHLQASTDITWTDEQARLAEEADDV